MNQFRLLPVLLLLPLLAACEQLGIETPAQTQARQDAEGRAIGSACRYSGRALEDCYGMNKRASKAAIFNGWKEMDAYMRENKIEVVPSAEKAPEPAKPAAEAEEAAKPAGKEAAEPAAKGGAEAPAKGAEAAKPEAPKQEAPKPAGGKPGLKKAA